jgi:hypothetical protein
VSAESPQDGDFDLSAFADGVLAALETLVAAQRHLLEELEALTDEVAALRAGQPAPAPIDESVLHDGTEALRREGAQVRHRSRVLAARSQALRQCSGALGRRSRARIHAGSREARSVRGR